MIKCVINLIIMLKRTKEGGKGKQRGNQGFENKPGPDSIASAEGLKTFKDVLKLLRKYPGNQKRITEAVRAIANRADALESDKRSILSIARISYEAENGLSSYLISLFGSGIAKLSEKESTWIRQRLERDLQKSTSGIKTDGISISNGFDEGKIRQLALLFQEYTKRRDDKVEEKTLDNLLKAFSARWSNKDDTVGSFSETTRHECAKAIWELEETRYEPLWDLINSESRNISGYMVSRMAELDEGGGWDLLDDYIKEGPSSSETLSGLFSEERGQAYALSRLKEGKMIKALTEAMAENPGKLSDELVAEADKRLETCQKAVLDILNSRKNLPENSRLYQLAEKGTNRRAVEMLYRFDEEAIEDLIRDGNVYAAEEVIGKHPERTKEVLETLKASGGKTMIKKGEEYKEIPVWADVVDRSLSDPYEKKPPFLEFLLETWTTRSLSMAVRRFEFGEMSDSLKTIRDRTGNETKFTMKRMIIWSLNEKRGADIRASALEYLNGRERIGQDILDLALKELGRDGGSRKSIMSAISLAEKHGLGKKGREFLLDVIRSNRRGLAPDAISVLRSKNESIPVGLTRKAFIDMRFDPRDPMTIGNAEKMAGIVLDTVPELSDDNTLFLKVKKLSGWMSPLYHRLIGAFAEAGNKTAEKSAEECIKLANTSLDKYEEGGFDPDDFSRALTEVAMMHQGGYGKAGDLLADDFIPVLFLMEKNADSRKDFARNALINITPAIMDTLNSTDETRRKNAEKVLPIIKKSLNEIAKATKMHIEAPDERSGMAIAQRLQQRHIFSKEMLRRYPELLVEGV